MDIVPTNNASQGNPSAGPASTNTGTIASDFDTILKMMTTQIENQDPLNPMDSTEFATQLATFSAVEQQTLTNEILREIAGEPALGGLATYSDWIGRQVAHPGAVGYDGQPVTLALSLPPGDGEHGLSIATADGLDLGTLSLEGTGSEMEWDGQLPGGGVAVPGDYVLSTVTKRPDGSTETAAVTSYAEVVELRDVYGEVQIVLAGGQTVAAVDVTAVRTR